MPFNNLPLNIGPVHKVWKNALNVATQVSHSLRIYNKEALNTKKKHSKPNPMYVSSEVNPITVNGFYSQVRVIRIASQSPVACEAGYSLEHTLPRVCFEGTWENNLAENHLGISHTLPRDAKGNKMRYINIYITKNHIHMMTHTHCTILMRISI